MVTRYKEAHSGPLRATVMSYILIKPNLNRTNSYFLTNLRRSISETSFKYFKCCIHRNLSLRTCKVLPTEIISRKTFKSSDIRPIIQRLVITSTWSFIETKPKDSNFIFVTYEDRASLLFYKCRFPKAFNSIYNSRVFLIIEWLETSSG